MPHADCMQLHYQRMKRVWSYSGPQVFILWMSWYGAILIPSENYYLTIQGFSEFMPTKTDNFSKFLKDNGNFFRVHVYQSYYRILYTFQSLIWTNTDIFRELLSNYTCTFHSSYKPILRSSESYHQTIYTFQRSYIPILIIVRRSPRFTKGGGGIDFLIFGNKGGDKIFFVDREGLD